jgi:hypothetical protein
MTSKFQDKHQYLPQPGNKSRNIGLLVQYIIKTLVELEVVCYYLIGRG